MACSPFQGGCCSGGYSLMQGFCSSLFFHHWHIWTELSGGLFSFRCFFAIRFSGNDSLREWRSLPAPRGQRKTVISLFWAASGR
ncbi:MAG: hypothetical protein BHW66_11815 [Akkermansia sp. 54_46]|nr:MAG: hypothetical protein BHW66_11815 [Akkermansia sp. 54_46]